jgi:hypothetical protein
MSENRNWPEKGHCRIVSNGTAIGSSVDVWTGETWISIRGVFAIKYVIDARTDERGGPFGGAGTAVLSMNLIGCDLTIPVGQVTLEAIQAEDRLR